MKTRPDLSLSAPDRAVEIACECSATIATIPAGARVVSRARATGTIEASCGNCGRTRSIPVLDQVSL
jgi:hypothetical protein